MKDRGGEGDVDPLESLPTELPKLIPVSTLEALREWCLQSP
jgi:hypothetical protein